MGAITKTLLSIASGAARYLSTTVDSSDIITIIDDKTGNKAIFDVTIVGGESTTLVFPFFKQSGGTVVSDTIALVGGMYLPFKITDGTTKNILLTTI